MSFKQESFAPVSAQGNSDSPNIWTYRTDDVVDDVIALDYFLPKFPVFNNGDFICINASDETVVGKINKVGNSFSIEVLAPSAGRSSMPIAPSGLFQADGGAWVPVSQTTNQTAFVWGSDTAKTNPGIGNIKGNNADLSLITEIYVSGTTQTGASALEVLSEAARGDFVYLSYMMDNGNFLILQASNYSVNEGGWISIEVSVVDSGGSLSDGQEINLTLIPTSPRANKISIERLYDGESAILVQEPSALDTPQYIQFGGVQGTISDPIQTVAQGADSEASILRINQAGTYRIKTAIQYGRVGASGTSILNFRVTTNGVQAGRSINQKLPNANTTSLFTDEAWLTLPAGIDIVYEVIRDSNGANSGGLIAGETSGSTGWNAAPSASLRVERWGNV